VKVGKKYKVQIEDCCVALEFEATLKFTYFIVGDRCYEFDNGIKIERVYDKNIFFEEVT
jgi:hypothetical protein